MTNKPITNWFKPTNFTNEKIKIKPDLKYKYFYLDWIDNEPSIKWLNTIPATFNYTKTIQLKDNTNKFQVFLYGNLNLEKSNPFSDLDKISKSNDYIEFSNVSLLKSVIQKSVRRYDKDIAIRASFHLMRLNFMEFIRRIVIIAIEDSCLHNHLSLFVWFMMTNDNDIIQIKHIRYFLGMVYYITKSKYYDRKFINNRNKNCNENIFSLIETLENKNIDLIQSLYIRKLYGGMKGDMKMLENTCHYLLSMLKSTSNMERFSEKIKSIKITNYLNKNNIPNYTIDFHCFPSIINYINELHPNLDKKTIKIIIWNNSSKINYRIDKNISLSSRWFLIEKDLNQRINYLKSNCY